MRRDAVVEIDSALSSISEVAKRAEVMLWDLTEEFFIHNDAMKHSATILYEYEYAAVRSRIAQDCVLKMIDEIEGVKQIVKKEIHKGSDGCSV